MPFWRSAILVLICFMALRDHVVLAAHSFRSRAASSSPSDQLPSQGPEMPGLPEEEESKAPMTSPLSEPSCLVTPAVGPCPVLWSAVAVGACPQVTSSRQLINTLHQLRI
jgi:hypothetical protein